MGEKMRMDSLPELIAELSNRSDTSRGNFKTNVEYFRTISMKTKLHSLSSRCDVELEILSEDSGMLYHTVYIQVSGAIEGLRKFAKTLNDWDQNG
jgi:hypothetical protein